MAAVNAGVTLYRADPTTALTPGILPNGYFGSSVTGWTPIGGALAWAQAPGRDREQGYARLTVDGSAYDAGIWAKGAGAAGADYYATASVRAASATVRASLAVASFTPAGALVTITYGPWVWTRPGLWVDLPSPPEYLVTAAGQTDVRLFVYVQGAPVGATFDIDAAFLRPVSGRVLGDDISCWVDSVSVAHGREDATAQVEPASATVDLTASAVDQISPLLVVGTWLAVTAYDSYTGVNAGRFLGKISDITWTWDDAGPETPNRASCQITAASRMADGGRGSGPARGVLEDVPEIVQLSNLMGLADDGVYYAFRDLDGGANGGALVNSPALSEGWDSLGEVRNLAAATGADLIENPATGYPNYMAFRLVRDSAWGDNEARNRATVEACDLRAGAAWNLTYDLVNTLTYTTKSPVGNASAQDPQSVAAFGSWSESIDLWTTETGITADAIAFYLSWRAWPSWNTDALDIDTDDIHPDLYSRLLSLWVLDTIAVVLMPDWAGPPGAAWVRVEGWAETFATTEAGPVHDFQINVSSGLGSHVVPSGPSQNTWDDGTKAWEEFPADQTWWDSWQAGKV